jgi:GNAT superfamily N-acetyltransferase
MPCYKLLHIATTFEYGEFEYGGNMQSITSDSVPGKFILDRGTAGHYDELSRFHYHQSRPATFAGIWSIRYRGVKSDPDIGEQKKLVAVGVLSYPTLASHARDRALDLARLPAEAKHSFINHHVRTISRVIVHPTYRSLGLARLLIQHLLGACPTRYAEAFAMMGRAHPMFERAGMTRYEPDRPDSPVYYLCDRIITAEMADTAILGESS